MSKLVVFCLDALCSIDVAYLRNLPNLGWVVRNGSYVLHAEPIYPSLTYPCHVSILTGNYVDRHGIPHNEMVKAGFPNQPWYNQRRDIRCPTLLDIAKSQGFSTCSISWPVTGGADFDLNMPMIVPIDYTGNHPIQFFENNATDELLEKYYEPYAHFIIGEDRNLDQFTMALALDIIRDYRQPDVMLIKMCDLDSVRHVNGVNHPAVEAQLNKHDQQFGEILNQIKNYGSFDETNFVILGDHGQSDITQAININVLLKEEGFIQVNDDGILVDFDAYAHSASLSAWIELKDPSDLTTKENVSRFLYSLLDSENFGIGHVYTKEQAQEHFHLTGPFDFILEGQLPISFNSSLRTNSVFGAPEYSGYASLKASHGGLPHKNETTTFIACGPHVRKGAVVDRRSIVDEAPTMAAFLGFNLNDISGKPIQDFIQ